MNRLLGVFRGGIPIIMLGIASLGSASAQIGLSLASGSGVPGSPVVLNLNLTDNPSLPASVQWAMSYSTADFSGVSVAIGGQSTAASKSITCNNASGTSNCVVYGLNTNTISTGVIATVTLTISPSTVHSSSNVVLTSSMVSSPAGVSISSSNSNGVVTITQPVVPTLSGVSCSPSTVVGGSSSTCTVGLSAVATTGPVTASLVSGNTALVNVPPSVTIPQGSSSTAFTATTSATGVSTPVGITASSAGVNVSTTLTVSSPCSYTLTPTSRSFSAGGGSTTVTVSGGTGCSWTATTDSPTWITLQAGGVSGNGNGSFVYSVVANPAAARLGTIAVGGTSFKVMEGGSASVVPFTDVTPATAYFDYISLMKSEGISAGCSASPPMYCPDTPVTRAQMAVFLVVALDLATGTTLTFPPTPYFQDVPASGAPDSIYFNYVQRIAQLGITAGCSSAPPLYCPDTALTQGQMAVFVISSWMKANNLSTFTYTTTPYFTDVPATDPFFKFVQKMKDMGFWTGCTATTYCESASVTRGDMAPMMMRGLLGAP